MALILNCKLTIANLGDSSAILIRNNQMLELTSEQVPTRIDEYQRIIERQGMVIPVGQIMRVQGVLAVTRAIGDIAYKDYITSEPEISSI
jgi:serine/threonine protein phosphatase PrpC